MAEAKRLSFDPREEYWRPPERRFAVAYLADQWTGHFAPAPALRDAARRIIIHFDRARADGLITYRGVEYDETGGLGKLCEELAIHALKLNDVQGWNKLKAIWPTISDTAGEDIAKYLRTVSTKDDWEPSFNRRLPWFGYLGATSDADLENRQGFFYAYANLWATTNAYTHGGAQNFAPVIQNTPTDRLLDAAVQWKKGINPLTATFYTLGKNDPDDEPQDRAGYSTVVEVYGFLNLERAPFYNNRAEIYRT